MWGPHSPDAFSPWFEARLGASLDLASRDTIPLVAVGEARRSQPLWAVRLGDRCLVTAKPDWVEPLRPVVGSLTPDELFSIFGAVELSRVTLAEAFGAWGPTWYYVADARTFRGETDSRVVTLTDEQVAAIDPEVSWHCRLGPEATYFGVHDEGNLTALAGVQPDDGEVWEISVDVAPQAKRRGLGRAVVGAAGRFILDHGRLVLTATAPWNVPSARLMRSLGMQHVLSDMRTMPAPFRVPPQLLGSPLPGAEMRQYYPSWGMNREILPRED
jgi:GNAT superfamily N-acetyltransferase